MNCRLSIVSIPFPFDRVRLQNADGGGAAAKLRSVETANRSSVHPGARRTFIFGCNERFG
jgi:hypothetical protein